MFPKYEHKGGPQIEPRGTPYWNKAVEDREIIHHPISLFNCPLFLNEQIFLFLNVLAFLQVIIWRF